jgi:hypothetical protein
MVEGCPTDPIGGTTAASVDGTRAVRQTCSVRTTASFRLIGAPGLTASAVTKALSVAPSRFHEAGEPRAAGASPKDTSIWILKSSDTIEDGVEPAVQLERLLQVLEPGTASREDQQKIAHGNAESLYGLTPSPSGPGDQTAQLREQS